MTVFKDGPFKGIKAANVPMSYWFYLYLVINKKDDIFKKFAELVPDSDAAINEEVEREILRRRNTIKFCLTHTTLHFIKKKFKENYRCIPLQVSTPAVPAATSPSKVKV